MMEGHLKPKRLRKMTEILKDLETLASEPNSSPITLSSESEEDPTETRQKRPDKKNKAPKLKTFNKLLDIPGYQDDYTVEEFEYLRDQPLDLDHTSKPTKKVLNQTIFKDTTSYKASNTLVKSVLTNRDKRDSLIIEEPKVSGFFNKNSSQNSREVFREELRSQINLRKTTHIDNDGIFDKPATDFEKKEKIFSDMSIGSGDCKGEEVKSAENSKNFMSGASFFSTNNSSPVHLAKEEKKQRCRFVEGEAEESGNEVSSDTNEDDEEGFLKELICDEPVNTDSNYEKHVKDMLEKEERELRMVVNAEFKRKKVDEKLSQASRKLKLSPAPPPPQKMSVFSKPQEDFDEDSRIVVMKHFRGIKNFTKHQKTSLILDEKSNDYLKLLQKPEPTCIIKSLLPNQPKFSLPGFSRPPNPPTPTKTPAPKPAKAFFIPKK